MVRALAESRPVEVSPPGTALEIDSQTMLLQSAERLARSLPQSAVVVDVGGGASPFPRADHVIDALPFQENPPLGHLPLPVERRFNRETWHQVDLCERKAWPFPDNYFDYALCSHVLEDVRDPIWLCSEIQRIARAGYIEVPSRIVEQSLGVEHPAYAGYHHHRWLIENVSGSLEFRYKPHLLHAYRDAIVARVGVGQKINPSYEVTILEWEGSFAFREVLEFDEDRTAEELAAYARKAQERPDLLVNFPLSPMMRLRRMAYRFRQARGFR